MPAPTTPPSSSPTSPTDPKNVALRTPLKLSRTRRPNIVPLTPQSLIAPRTPSGSKHSVNAITPFTPNRKLPSNRSSNWRIREESSSPSDSRENESLGEGSSVPPTTPSKPIGPFTPQVPKRARSPLRLDVLNYTPSGNPNVRGSFTDPPPRRRATRPQLNDEDYLDSGSVVASRDTVTDEVACLGSPIRDRAQPPPGPASVCASCGGTERLSLLQPCQHQICAPCVTGSLNVVGEKDMICMYCLSPIESFKISRPSERIHSRIPTQTSLPSPLAHENVPCQRSPDSFVFVPQAPPALGRLPDSPTASSTSIAPPTVLRIDNVPWDVTPPMIEKWLGVPTFVCHVLLDRADGRTLNHAFVETTIDNAKLALRTQQNKVLGYGRRARAVTITLASQEELMHALFPSWPGKFDGVRPVYETSLVDQQSPQPVDLLTNAQLGVVLHLIQSPKSHFLKVPSLAYWSLLSILAKIPAPDVFAPGTVPEMLFDITIFALEKYESQVGSRGYDPLLHTKLIDGAIHCKAFTDRQLSLLLPFTNRPPPVMQFNHAPDPRAPLPVHNDRPPQGFVPPNMVPQVSREVNGLDRGPIVTLDAYERVAQDFGVDPALIHALVERLVVHSSNVPAPYRHH